MNKPRVFRDEKLQNEFDENGFVKIRMFSPEQIKRLHDFYVKTQHQHETVIDKKKFHATNDTDNADLIQIADSFIKDVMFEEIDKHFYNYKTIAANYLVKQSSPESELGPHQDLRFVDEESFYSLNIWVATEPTNKENGCLRFLKGSHRLHNTIRTLPAYPWKYESVIKEISKHFTDVKTELGDCIILNHACIHGSYPNLSRQTRIAAILAIIPEDASIYHYFLPDGNPDNKVEKYAMTLNDFINLKGGQRPQHAVLEETFMYDFSPVNAKSFLKYITNKRSQENNVYQFIRNQISALFKGVR